MVVPFDKERDWFVVDGEVAPVVLVSEEVDPVYGEVEVSPVVPVSKEGDPVYGDLGAAPVVPVSEEGDPVAGDLEAAPDGVDVAAEYVTPIILGGMGPVPEAVVVAVCV